MFYPLHKGKIFYKSSSLVLLDSLVFFVKSFPCFFTINSSYFYLFIEQNIKMIEDCLMLSFDELNLKLNLL